MRILSRANVQKSLALSEAIAIVRDAFAQLSTHQATVPVRVPISIPQHDGIILFMPAHLHTSDALAVKIVSVHNQNPAKNLPLIHALVVVMDATTGKPLAAMEGGYLTALRTGAGSGVATDLLARRDAKVAAIFGAGVQGRMQLRAIAAVRQLERVYVYDAIPSQIEKFIADVRNTPGIPSDLRAAAFPRDAVREADIICTATTSTLPVFDGNDLKPGVHINAIGAYTPTMREVDEITLTRASKIVIDHRASALAEAGDLLIAIKNGAITEANIYAEIGEIAAGKKPGREREDEITFYKSVGNAVQDASVARAIYDAAVREGLGVEVEL
jgi:ornithine cyclodeaminase/alanine dehydrogenase-like protein (mu-crystallin family)